MTQKGNKGGRDGDPDRIPDEDIGALADSNGAHTHHNLTPFSGLPLTKHQPTLWGSSLYVKAEPPPAVFKILRL